MKGLAFDDLRDQAPACREKSYEPLDKQVYTVKKIFPVFEISDVMIGLKQATENVVQVTERRETPIAGLRVSGSEQSTVEGPDYITAIKQHSRSGISDSTGELLLTRILKTGCVEEVLWSVVRITGQKAQYHRVYSLTLDSNILKQIYSRMTQDEQKQSEISVNELGNHFTMESQNEYVEPGVRQRLEKGIEYIISRITVNDIVSGELQDEFQDYEPSEFITSSTDYCDEKAIGLQAQERMRYFGDRWFDFEVSCGLWRVCKPKDGKLGYIHEQKESEYSGVRHHREGESKSVVISRILFSKDSSRLFFFEDSSGMTKCANCRGIVNVPSYFPELDRIGGVKALGSIILFRSPSDLSTRYIHLSTNEVSDLLPSYLFQTYEEIYIADDNDWRKETSLSYAYDDAGSMLMIDELSQQPIFYKLPKGSKYVQGNVQEPVVCNIEGNEIYCENNGSRNEYYVLKNRKKEYSEKNRKIANLSRYRVWPK